MRTTISTQKKNAIGKNKTMIDYLNIDINGLTEPFLYLVLKLDCNHPTVKRAKPFYDYMKANQLIIKEYYANNVYYMLVKYLDYFCKVPYYYKGLTKYLRFQPVHTTIKTMWEPIKLFYDDKGEYKNDKWWLPKEKPINKWDY